MERKDITSELVYKFELVYLTTGPTYCIRITNECGCLIIFQER